MLSVEEARRLMLGAACTLPSEAVSLGEAHGRTLAAPIAAQRDQPPFSASAMDGYALRASDTPGALMLVGESAAGRGYAKTLGADECVRISTGAPLPEGADAVLIQEDARVEAALVHAIATPSGQHVRRRGGDFRAGETLLRPGTRLDPAALALAAGAGAAALSVARAPRVALLFGGDEIVAPGGDPNPWQIYDSCSFGVEAWATNWGARVTRFGPLPDDRAALERAAREALAVNDLLVFIGGASVGPHDHARAVLEKLGAAFLVNKVAVRPGKPTWFATVGAVCILGLPGNPASAFATARLFLAPILDALQGREPSVAFQHARLGAPLPANGPREHYMRARVRERDGQLLIEAFADQDSSLMGVAASANALLQRAPNAPAAREGELARYLAWS